MTTNGKPILVATDLSARSDRAIDRATFLAQQWGVRLFVLHALEPGSRLEAKPELAEQAIRAALPDPEADVGIVPAIGPAPTVIVEAAASAGCGLIVTGVARFNHVSDFLIGTAVDHVIRHATAPVLVVKQRPHGPYCPDSESRPWVESIARPLGLEVLLGEKVRKGDREISLAVPCIASVRGRPAMLVDDLISSGTTLIACERQALPAWRRWPRIRWLRLQTSNVWPAKGSPSCGPPTQPRTR